MPILYLSTNEDQSKHLKELMTDQMWSSVTIRTHTGDTYLLLEDSLKITETSDIIRFLSKDLPPISKQLSNAKQAATKAYNYTMKTGKLPIASPELTESRRKICSSCPFKKRKMFADVCTSCGCFIKRKTATLTESCPLNKW